MDYFRLLTRSSKVNKVPSRQQDALPSAGGQRSKDDAYAEEKSHLEGSQQAPRGVKRKRSKSKQDVSSHASTGEAGPQSCKQGDLDTVTIRKVFGSDGSNVQSYEERKRNVRTHKIKVTLLSGPNDALQQPYVQRNKGTVVEPPPRKSSRELFPCMLTSFHQLRSWYPISKRLGENILSQGYRLPTEVQMASLPILLDFDRDGGIENLEQAKTNSCPYPHLLTVSPTGSGKTLAFLIPIIQNLITDDVQIRQNDPQSLNDSRRTRAVVLAPTHELVEQIVNEGKKLAQGTRIKISALKKGMTLYSHILENEDDNDDDSMIDKHQDSARSAPSVKSDILISTPPMLLHALSADSPASNEALSSVQRLVLDEADILLDKMFHDQTVDIWNACTNPSLRTSLWSATINSTIESFATNFILDRRRLLGVENTTIPHYIVRLVVGLKDSSIPNIDHRLLYAASERGKLITLRQLLHPATPSSNELPPLRPPFLVFTQTIPRAIALHSELLYDIPPEAGGSSRIAVLHSELSETARSKVMAGVRKGEIWVLITTDLLSRGIDFKGMNGVVSYDIPSTSASYVHRAGRTGRQGREGGVAITLYTKEDIPYVKNVANVIAASKNAKAALDGDGKAGGEMQQWLLDSLPDVSKRTRQRLKQSGIEHRKQSLADKDPKLAKKMRISTKSGYDRRMENRRKGARLAHQKQSRLQNHRQSPAESEEWGGLD